YPSIVQTRSKLPSSARGGWRTIGSATFALSPVRLFASQIRPQRRHHLMKVLEGSVRDTGLAAVGEEAAAGKDHVGCLGSAAVVQPVAGVDDAVAVGAQPLDERAFEVLDLPPVDGA